MHLTASGSPQISETFLHTCDTNLPFPPILLMYFSLRLPLSMLCTDAGTGVMHFTFFLCGEKKKGDREVYKQAILCHVPCKSQNEAGAYKFQLLPEMISLTWGERSSPWSPAATY